VSYIYIDGFKLKLVLNFNLLIINVAVEFKRKDASCLLVSESLISIVIVYCIVLIKGFKLQSDFKTLIDSV